MNTLGERIKQLRGTRGLTQDELAENTGISTSNISRIEKGDVVPSATFLLNICRFFEVSSDWLLMGESMKDDTDDTDDMVEVLVYDEPAAAGLGTYLSDYASYEKINFPASEVPRRTDCGIRIKGDSMEPEIESGEIVFVELTPIVEIGEIGIFVHDERAYCKRLEIDRQRRLIMLTSVNEDYEPIVIKRDSVLRTVGRVLKNRR